MEQMTEEELCVAILAKLKEIGKKLDDNNQKLDEVNAQLRCISKSSDQPASASSSSSLTSSPPQDGSLVASNATPELLPTAPTKCSTAGPNQDAHGSVLAPMSSASATASPTSSPPWDAAHVVLAMATKLLEMAPARCSLIGPNRAAHVPESATIELALLSASSFRTSLRDAILVTSAANMGLPPSLLAGCSMVCHNFDPQQDSHMLVQQWQGLQYWCMQFPEATRGNTDVSGFTTQYLPYCIFIEVNIVATVQTMWRQWSYTAYMAATL